MHMNAIAWPEPVQYEPSVSLIQQCRRLLLMPATGVRSVTLLLPVTPQSAERILIAGQRIAEEFGLAATVLEFPGSVILRLSPSPEQQ